MNETIKLLYLNLLTDGLWYERGGKATRLDFVIQRVLFGDDNNNLAKIEQLIRELRLND